MSKRNNEIVSLLETLRQQTNELLANQMLYNELVEKNTDGLLVLDEDGIIRFANRMAAAMFNFKKSKKLEGELFAFTPDPDQVKEIEIANPENVLTVEMRAVWIEWESRPAKLVILRNTSERNKIRASLQKTSESLKSLVNASPLAIIVIDIGKKVTIWSKAAEDIFGWTESETRGKPFPWPDTELEEIYECTLAGESVMKREISGTYDLYKLNKVFNLWSTLLNGSTPSSGSVMLMIADITESRLQKRQMEMELLRSEERFRIALSNSPVSVSTQDTQFRYTWAHNPFAGIMEESLLGKTDSELFTSEDAAQLLELKSGALQSGSKSRHEIKLQQSGQLYFYDLSIEPLQDETGYITGIACAATDVSALRHTESKAAFALHHDSLTGLPNRTLFHDRLKQTLSLAQRTNQHFALIHCGVDQFKIINQGFGHLTGDRILLEIGKRLATVMYEIDTIARVGGDEFLILVSNIQDSQDAASIVKKVIATFHQSFLVEAQEIYLTASVGVSVYPNDGMLADDLLRNADIAMHRAKEDLGRGNYQFFCANMHSRTRDILTLERDLHKAIQQHEFRLHFQPQFHFSKNEVAGVEALLRWPHPERGNVPPSEFIPVAENSGLIVEIGDWVLRAACLQHREWLDAGLPPVRIAVNLSARQFLDDTLIERVAAALDLSGMDARYLELELTESMLLRNAETTLSILNEFKKMGVRLSIDDFGTGYSSLSYLKRFPLDTLKIDRSFVTDLGTHADNGAIALAIIAMAHALELEVVAEGVENTAQLALLKAAGCDMIQGYYFSKPLPAGDCQTFLQQLQTTAELSLD